MTMMHILLMTSPGGKGGGAMGLVFPIALVAVFYFFMIRPQTKKAKDQKAFRANLQKGDKVVTIGGIHGKIIEVQETTFTIEVEGGNRLRVEQSAIAMENTALLNSDQSK